MRLQLNGHNYSDAHVNLDLNTNTLMVTSNDPSLILALAKAQQAIQEMFEGEYFDDTTAYALAGGIIKSGNPQTGTYQFIFDTVAY